MLSPSRHLAFVQVQKLESLEKKSHSFLDPHLDPEGLTKHYVLLVLTFFVTHTKTLQTRFGYQVPSSHMQCTSNHRQLHDCVCSLQRYQMETLAWAECCALSCYGPPYQGPHL